MPTYQSVIDALSANDLTASRDLLLAEIMEETKDRHSWDCPYYTADRTV